MSVIVYTSEEASVKQVAMVQEVIQTMNETKAVETIKEEIIQEVMKEANEEALPMVSKEEELPQKETTLVAKGPVRMESAKEEKKENINEEELVEEEDDEEELVEDEEDEDEDKKEEKKKEVESEVSEETYKTDGLRLQGNLELDGGIKAKSFIQSDGTKLSEVTKLALPKNVHYSKGKVGINQPDPRKALDILGGLKVKGRTELLGNFVFELHL
jgi:hypothetical protein